MKNILASLLVLYAFTSANASVKADHSIWDELLKEHVSSSGNVDYKGFKKDIEKFDEYLIELRCNATRTEWTKNELETAGINYDILMLRREDDDINVFKGEAKKHLSEENDINVIMSIGDMWFDVNGNYSGYIIKLPSQEDDSLYHLNEQGKIEQVM